MRNLYRLLLVSLLSFCFLCSGANAACLLDDCASLSDKQAREAAAKFIKHDQSVIADFFETSADSHCASCNKKTQAIAKQVINQCPSVCAANYPQRDCTSYCNSLTATMKREMADSNSCYTASNQQTGSIIVNGLQSFSDITNLRFSSAVSNWNEMMTGIRNGRSNKGKAFAVKYTEILNRFLEGGSNGCWFCPIFKTIFIATNTLATDVYIHLRGLFLSLLAIFTMAWLLWTTFRFITTIHGPNVGEFVTTLFKGLGTAMLLSIILWAPPSFITRYVVDPIAAFGAGLSQEILNIQNKNRALDTINYTAHSFKPLAACEADSTEVLKNIKTIQVCQKDTSINFDGMALSGDVYFDMDCLLRRVSLELIFGVSLGAAAISDGITGGRFGLPKPTLFLIGLLVFISYFLLYVAVPIRLIDLLMRFAFVVILLPLFIACMATKKTREYSKKGWEMFLSCWITLITLSLFITFAITIINIALER